MSKRLSRLTLVAVTAVGIAFSTGTAAANPSANALEQRSDHAPGGAETHADDHRPYGVGQGRKVG
jgi:hypothetical protein